MLKSSVLKSDKTELPKKIYKKISSHSEEKNRSKENVDSFQDLVELISYVLIDVKTILNCTF